jgi:hypothetical protein
VLLLVGYITIGTVIVTWINWQLDRNEKTSLAEIKARIDQYGGEENVKPEDRIFATVKPAPGSRRVMKPFLRVDTLSRTLFEKPLVAAQPGQPAPRSAKAAPEEAGMNRMTRRVSARERKRREREEAKQAELKARQEKAAKAEADGK